MIVATLWRIENGKKTKIRDYKRFATADRVCTQMEHDAGADGVHTEPIPFEWGFEVYDKATKRKLYTIFLGRYISHTAGWVNTKVEVMCK